MSILFRRTIRISQITRSEEHTSELQSRQYLVCRLLLAKKRYKVYDVTLRADLALVEPPADTAARRRASAEARAGAGPAQRAAGPATSGAVFFLNDTATTEIYPLSLPDALPIYLYSRIPRQLDAAEMSLDEIQQLSRQLRSEEHTSELQSRQYLVCRLLLEK